MWGWLSYDPELNLVYYGTSNPGPWNEGMRKGDNKWSCAILARDADTGELRWAFQVTPHDMWDYDAVNENILVDLPLGGTTRKALVHFDRNGYGYTLDRATGEVLVAQPFVPMNWSTGVDMKTGRPTVVPEKMTAEGKLVKDICPSLEGGKNQQPAAFSPQTGLFYVPTNNLCMDFEVRPVSYIPGTPYIGANAPEKKGAGRPRRRVHRVGRDDRQESLGHPGAVPGLGRRARDGGRRRVLRHARRLVQGGGRELGQGALEVQGRLGRRW